MVFICFGIDGKVNVAIGKVKHTMNFKLGLDLAGKDNKQTMEEPAFHPNYTQSEAPAHQQPTQQLSEGGDRGDETQQEGALFFTKRAPFHDSQAAGTAQQFEERPSMMTSDFPHDLTFPLLTPNLPQSAYSAQQSTAETTRMRTYDATSGSADAGTASYGGFYGLEGGDHLPLPETPPSRSDESLGSSYSSGYGSAQTTSMGGVDVSSAQTFPPPYGDQSGDAAAGSDAFTHHQAASYSDQHEGGFAQFLPQPGSQYLHAQATDAAPDDQQNYYDSTSPPAGDPTNDMHGLAAEYQQHHQHAQSYQHHPYNSEHTTFQNGDPNINTENLTLSHNAIMEGADEQQHEKPKRKRKITRGQRTAANQRERRRMLTLNEAFSRLQQRVPAFAYERKLSRIDTLKLAIGYIWFMGEVLRGVPPQALNFTYYLETLPLLGNSFYRMYHSRV